MPSPDLPRIVPTVSAEEANRGTYNTANLQAALEALHQDGFVVLKGVVDVDHVREINEFMCKEADELVRNKSKPYNQGVNSNILQGPPTTDPKYLHNDIFFNSFVIQVMNAYLGANPITNFLTGNNALPKTSGLRQPVHKDITFFHPHCPFFCIANIPLCPFTPHTGSTEFWLGSHAHTTGSDQVIASSGDVLANARLRAGFPSPNVLPDVVEARRAVRPPIQPEAEVGDVLIRDVRTWHAGMPNDSDQYRIMLALGYQAQWYPNHSLRSKLPLSQANFFMKHGGQPVELRADFLPDDAEFGLLNDQFTFRQSETELENKS